MRISPGLAPLLLSNLEIAHLNIPGITDQVSETASEDDSWLESMVQSLSVVARMYTHGMLVAVYATRGEPLTATYNCGQVQKTGWSRRRILISYDKGRRRRRGARHRVHLVWRAACKYIDAQGQVSGWRGTCSRRDRPGWRRRGVVVI